MSRTMRGALLLASICLFNLQGFGLCLRTNSAWASEQSGEPVASLKDQLEKGLRARRAIEVTFVTRVAQLVDQGRLSREMVQGSFAWTLKKYRYRKTLVPYFEQVLRHRASKVGNTSLDQVPTTLPQQD